MPLSKSRHYINNPFQQIHSGVDSRYLDPGPGNAPTKCYDRRVWNPEVRAAAFELYWGKYENGRFLIGVRGKIIGLCMLRNFLSKENRSWKTLGEEIVTHSRQSWLVENLPDVRDAMQTLEEHSEPPADRQQPHEFEEKTIAGWLASLIRDTSSRSVPPAECAKGLLDIVAAYFVGAAKRAKLIVNMSEAFEAIRSLPPGAGETPSNFARAAASHLNIDLGAIEHQPIQASEVKIPPNDTVPTSRHYLERAIRNYVEATEEPLDIETNRTAKVSEIRRDLGIAADQQPRLLVLTGGPHTGKKAIVGDLLRRLPKDDEGTLHLPLVGIDSGPAKKLPVFVINARRMDYLELVVEVLVFLERCRLPSGKNGVPDFDVMLVRRLEELGGKSNLALEPLLTKVAKLHEGHPAFFIIMDVHGSRRDSILKVVRNYGINRLLRTLFRSCPDSRILITDPEGGGTTYGLLDGAETPKIIKLEQPTIDRLVWYLPNHRDQVTAVIDQIPSTKTTGTALIGLAALLGQIDGDTALFEEQLKARASEIVGGADAATKRIYKDLVALYEQLGCLEALALICASEDGLMENTLIRALDAWPAKERGENWKSTSTVLSTLDDIGKKSSWMLVREHESVRYDREELSFDESGPSAFLEVTGDIREAILLAMQTDEKWRKISRIAHRRIAIAARRRAQIKKMRSSGYANGSHITDGRDIQSYAALLASIDPSEFAAETTIVEPEVAAIEERHALIPASHSLRLSTGLVFTSGESFDARVALRFAVRCQLHEDIDHDFRLSMINDQDELRLRLYLLAFCDLGVPHFWSVDSLRKSSVLKGLPKKIPDHVKNAFTNIEIFNLLVTIALSGLHCQFPRIILWARDRLEELKPRLKPDEEVTWLIALTRIRCSQLDMHILRGNDFDSALKNAKAWTEEVEDKFPAANGEISRGRPPKKDIRILKAWMRLRAREAELIWMTAGDRTAVNQIYTELADLEHELADQIDQDDPIILSGRTARRFIKFLTGDAPLFVVGPRPELAYQAKDDPSLLLVRQMLEINISRLRRFGGADRVGVLVDIARRYHLERKGLKALGYGDLAVENTFSGSVSHGGKIDVLSVNAGLHLFEAETHIAAGSALSQAREHLNKAKERIRLLTALADALHFEPSKALGSYLSARLSVATNHLDSLDNPKIRRSARVAREHLELAANIARRYGGLLFLEQMEFLREQVAGSIRG